MSIPLRILLIEDSDDDALLLLHEVRKGGYQIVHERVDNPEDMRKALEEQAFDIVISDHRMPNFSAPAALALLKERGVDLPFIIVSGSIGEEVAVEALKAGASDYIVKGTYSRLVPAIKRSLKEAEVRREHKLGVEALRESEEKFRTLFQNANDVICVYKLGEKGNVGNFIEVNDLACEKLGYRREDFFNLTPLDITAVEKLTGEGKIGDDLLSQGHATFESILRTKDNDTIPFEINSHVFTLKETKLVLAICRDITERKIAENEMKNSLVKVKKAMEGIVLVTAKTVEMRDPYTAGHQRSVGKLASAIGKEMNLPEDEIMGIRFACDIHDVGKIYIPAEILCKPGRLTSIEFDLIRTHPQMGYDILKMIDFPWPIAKIVAQHHERMDGSGYPHGLCGEDICLGAKILGVADAVETIASHRPYRPSLGLDKALDEIYKNKGCGYDARVVDACLSLFRNKQFALDNSDETVSLRKVRDV